MSAVGESAVVSVKSIFLLAPAVDHSYESVLANHIGVDADSGLVHTVRGTAGHVNDVVEANSLLHGQETDVFVDSGAPGGAQAV
jgi:IS5 family transposase